MDRKAGKLMTMNGALHPRADMDRLYVTLGEGGRGWMSVEDVVRVEQHSLSDYLKRAEVNLDRDAFVKEKGKQEMIREQKKMKWMDGVTSHYMGSVRQELMRKVVAVGDVYK